MRTRTQDFAYHHLRTLADMRRRDQQNIERRIAETVADARTLGLSWSAIAKQLRTTKQAAWQRYGSKTDG